jgi:hypothetical protein
MGVDMDIDKEGTEEEREIEWVWVVRLDDGEADLGTDLERDFEPDLGSDIGETDLREADSISTSAV